MSSSRSRQIAKRHDRIAAKRQLHNALKLRTWIVRAKKKIRVCTTNRISVCWKDIRVASTCWLLTWLKCEESRNGVGVGRRWGSLQLQKSVHHVYVLRLANVDLWTNGTHEQQVSIENQFRGAEWRWVVLRMDGLLERECSNFKWEKT